MTHYRRKKFFVDPKVQGLLVLRAIAYWLGCMVTMELVRLAWLIVTGPEQPSFVAYFTQFDWLAAGGRMLLGSLLLLPITRDLIRFSNRFAGPVFRMRRILRDIAQGGAVEPVRLRRDDFWHGLADDLNAALQRLSKQGASPGPGPSATGSAHANSDVTEADAQETSQLAACNGA